MQKFILVIFTMLTLVFGAMTTANASQNFQVYGEDDVLPWPWGTECPFPWNDIEGVWKTSLPKKQQNSCRYEGGVDLRPSYYEFKVESTTSTDSRLVEITKFNMDGDIIGRGRGYSSRSQKIVRAVIVASQGVNMANHRVIVRAYRRKSTLSCGNELVTVLTTRSINNESTTDRHYVLKKVPLEL